MPIDAPERNMSMDRAQLWLSRLLLGLGLFAVFAGGRPMHKPMLPALIPFLPYAGVLLLAGVVGACVGFQDRASLIWLVCFAAVAIPLHFAWSNSSMLEFRGESDALTGWGELAVRCAALGATGVWVNLERQRGIFDR
jgi:hypothetical protein